MAILAAATTLSRAGVQIDNGAAADVAGDSFANTGVEYLVVENASAGPVTATFAVQAQIDGLPVSAGKQVVVPAGATFIIGPFPKQFYNDGNGRVNVTYSAVTTVSVKVVKSA